MPPITLDFNDQTVLVTGGTRGIGGAISTAFLEAGAHVLATYGSSEQAAQRFEEQHADHGERLETCRFDVSDYAAVESFFKDLRDRIESLEVLVNNAGIRKDGVLAMMSHENWQSVLDVNLGGTYAMCKFGVQLMMRARYGRIINITSPSGKLGFPGQANYAASKAGQVALTRSLSKEIGKRGITVNCVSPGFIDTELLSDLTEEQKKTFADLVAVKRFGTPAEVAAAVLFTASREAAYINGSVIEVTGGL